MATKDELWLRTDQREDVAASLRHALRSWLLTSEDPQEWKWVTLALHSALQGACICHLTTTAEPIGALTDESATSWMEYIAGSNPNGNTVLPKTRILELPELLKAIRKANSIGSGVQCSGVAISDGELNWLLKFHREIRNQFVHFEPRGWSIEVSGLPEIAKLVSRIIRDILDQGWAFRHSSHTWKLAVLADLASLSSMS